MRKPCKCGSWAINDGSHGREPGVDLHLCDVCYWRTRAQPAEEVQPVAWRDEQYMGGVRWDESHREGIPDGAPLYTRPPAAEADRMDAERLEWVSHAWGGQRHDYANHVLLRGGDGDLSDIRAFIDRHLPARAALCPPAEEGGKS